MSICSGRRQTLSTAEKISCSACSGAYHYFCVNLSKENFLKLSVRAKSLWKCPECKLQRKVGDFSETPVKGTETGDTEVLLPSLDMIDKRLKLLESNIRASIESQIKAEFEQLRESLAVIPNLVKTIEELSTKYDDMHTELISLHVATSGLKAENDQLRENIKDLDFRVAQSEQQARENNVEIQCLPEHENENLISTVIQLGNLVSCPIEEKDILSCSRVAKTNRSSTRPRSVIVKLPSPRVRDSLLAACMTFNKANPLNKLNSSHVGIAATEKQQIYVAEHLSPRNRALQAQARALKREQGYKHLWTRNGRILMRKDDASAAIWIKDLELLATLRE